MRHGYQMNRRIKFNNGFRRVHAANAIDKAANAPNHFSRNCCHAVKSFSTITGTSTCLSTYTMLSFLTTGTLTGTGFRCGFVRKSW